MKLRTSVMAGALAVLSACGAPQMQASFAQQPVEVNVGRNSYAVTPGGLGVEIVPLRSARRPGSDAVFAAAIIAAEIATGCAAQPATLEGTVRRMTLRMTCE